MTAGSRTHVIVASMALLFVAVAGQLVRLAASGAAAVTIAASDPIGQSFARPDIVDRNGRLMATDVTMPSLFADPSIVVSRDEVAERLSAVLPDVPHATVMRLLEDRSRRFVWLRRGLSPRLAQRVHDLGLPGVAFRDELRRAYPLGRLAGHTLGFVSVDNKGLEGIERHIDEVGATEAVHGAALVGAPPVRLTLDIGVQHALEDELDTAMRRFAAKGAAGLVMDVTNGEMLAVASLPGFDPLDGAAAATVDKITGGTYELGSIFKLVTVALALEDGRFKQDTVIDVTQPLAAGRFTIADPHPLGRPLTVAEIFIHSSNVGAARLALDAGAARQRAFLDSLGLTAPMRTEDGPVAPPTLPPKLDRVEQITVAYGHGIAVAPLQFARAAAALVNGGVVVQPTFLRGSPKSEQPPRRVVSEATSAAMRDLMRRNVADPAGTGRRAEVAGLEIGGKTGTAEMPGRGGYREKAVIASFLAAFPMSAPRYLVLVSLFEPQGSEETKGEILAGLNAAPTAGRVIERIAPLLEVATTVN